MRLIDADTLKKAIFNYFDGVNSVYGTYILRDVNVIIDNAPMIEYTFEDAFQKTVCEQKLYCPNKRPTGKWITRTEDNGVNYRFYCSCCDREVTQITDFCPYCGADMRGAEDEADDKTEGMH